MNCKSAHRAVCILIGGILSGCQTSFVVIGDVPYDDKDEAMLQEAAGVISPKDGRPAYPFVIHVGDYKASGIPCSESVDDRFSALLEGLSPVPVFYTPGDNEWVDCDRFSTSELKRLDVLRSRFFSSPPANSAGFGYSSQSDQPENASWHHRGIRFITLHVTGTKNGREWVSHPQDDPVAAAQLAGARDAANVEWLEAAFDLAKSENAGAVVVAMQADINILRAEYFEQNYEYGTRCAGPATRGERPDKCDAFVAVRDALLSEVGEFGGPVLLIHGDTWPFMLAKVFTEGGAALDLWVLNVAGDARCDNGSAESISNATVVTVNLRSSRPFDAARLIDREFSCP